MRTDSNLSIGGSDRLTLICHLYTSRLESRIAQLPKELETGLDPPRIAKLLGESLRQCFQQSGLPDTARALDQSCSE